MSRLLSEGWIEFRPDPLPEPDGALGTISVETNDEDGVSCTVNLISVGDPIVYLDSRSPVEPRGLSHKGEPTCQVCSSRMKFTKQEDDGTKRYQCPECGDEEAIFG